MVVDEAQRIKSVDAQLRADLRRLQVDHNILLTGTPIQNNMAELWSLLNYMDSKTYDSPHPRGFVANPPVFQF